MIDKPRRSALYMPASNPRAIEKAKSLDADVVILDLEDAVAPDQKEEARAAAVAAVRAGGFGRREVVIRVNAFDTPWAKNDLAAVSQAGADAILLPKVGSPEQVAAARGALGERGPELWAMIETGQAIVGLPPICAPGAALRMTTLVVGTNDLAKELHLRVSADRAQLLPILSQIVLNARVAGLTALDGVCNALDDPARFEAECRQGLAWGFDGKTLIHPSQVAPANTVFSPSADEIAWARVVVDAFEMPENAGKGALRVDGQMIELLHRDEALRLLAIANAIPSDS